MFSVIIGAFVTILGYFITRYIEQQKIREQKIREQKIPVYEKFINFYFDKFRDVKKNPNSQESKNKGELIDFFWDMKRKSILWLSDDTFNYYLNWEKQYREKFKEDIDENNLLEHYLSFTDILLEFRKDIGHKNKNIKSEDIKSLIISDYEDFSKKDKK
jgi:hypothetical protein